MTNEWKPDWAIHPGQVLDEQMETQGLSVYDVARVGALSEEQVRGVLAQTERVTEQIANGLELATGLLAEIWLGIQIEYDGKAA